MYMKVRNEQPSDYKRVEEIAREAFWNLYFPGAHEHVIVNKMRNSKDFIKELAFVIEVDDKIEGAIFYTHSKIVTNDNKEFKTISFGPVFISPNYHRKGLGKKLITHSIEQAKKMGFNVITTLGFPYHYKPYGFLGGKKYSIMMEDGQYHTGLLILPLVENVLDGISGVAKFSTELEVTEEQVEAFEINLPHKEKLVLPCQAEFEKACMEVE